TILNSGLYVIGGTVTVGAGSNVKIRDSADGFNLSAAATLTVAGTETKPVIFTSQRDDTAGGDTNNDSDETLPSESNYNRLVVNRGSSHTTMDWVQIKYVTTAAQITSGEATLTNAQISSATDGIIAAGTATVTFRGSFAAISDRAVIACNWGAACAVDATSTSWGSDDGPLPAEGTALICGAVTYSPWLTSTGTAGDETSPVALNCNATNS
ncbi:MAG TPA: hypothetical protein VLF62_00600, partial [Candidatus Saccharimonadales bacterium]|nr:hypothetical protein [Candidatus Saccharimonadales bacterium]